MPSNSIDNFAILNEHSEKRTSLKCTSAVGCIEKKISISTSAKMASFGVSTALLTVAIAIFTFIDICRKYVVNDTVSMEGVLKPRKLYCATD